MYALTFILQNAKHAFEGAPELASATCCCMLRLSARSQFMVRQLLSTKACALAIKHFTHSRQAVSGVSIWLADVAVLSSCKFHICRLQSLKIGEDCRDTGVKMLLEAGANVLAADHLVTFLLFISCGYSMCF